MPKHLSIFASRADRMTALENMPECESYGRMHGCDDGCPVRARGDCQFAVAAGTVLFGATKDLMRDLGLFK